MENKHIGKRVIVKFGTFHGSFGTIQSMVHLNGHDRYMVKLQNGKIIPKKIKNIIILKDDNK